jgi:hypothetical protein
LGFAACGDAGGCHEHCGGRLGRARQGRVTAHQRRCDGSFCQYRKLRSQAVRIGRVQPHQQLSEPQTPLLLDVGGDFGYGITQICNRVDVSVVKL